MRRLIALIIMLLVPLQFTWSVAVSVHGHVGKEVVSAGSHTHDHDHAQEGGGHHDHDVSPNTNSADHNEDGHYEHYHPVFSYILVETGMTLAVIPPGGAIPQPAAAFFSRTPPLFDRPPLAFA